MILPRVRGVILTAGSSHRFAKAGVQTPPHCYGSHLRFVTNRLRQETSGVIENRQPRLTAMPELAPRPSARSVADVLSGTPLFSGLAARPVIALAARARLLDVAAGETIYQRDDRADILYVVVSGGPVEILVADAGGAELILARPGPRQTFGELALLDGSRRAESARTARNVRLLELPRDAVMSVALTAPVVMQRLLSGLGGTMHRIIDHATSVPSFDLHERVVGALVEIEARIARGAPAPSFEDLQRELPARVGAAPEAVEEVLRSFEELGYIQAGRDHVRITSNRSQQGVLRGGMSWTALVNQVLHDPLTQLANRMLFHERLHQAVTDGIDATRKTAVLMIDLDGFKGVNDTLGHAAGDELLIKVADRLRGCLRRPDTAARLGGDEFAVVVTDVDIPATAGLVADRVLAAVGRPFLINDEIVQVGASIGVALSTSDSGDQLVGLIGRADAAMYRAKKAGKRRWEMESVASDPGPSTGAGQVRVLADRRLAGMALRENAQAALDCDLFGEPVLQ